jgi:PAS domain S-box-containing protein
MPLMLSESWAGQWSEELKSVQFEMPHPSEADEARQQYESQERRIAKLYMVSKALQHRGWSLPFLVQLVLDAAVELSEAECGALVMLDKDGHSPIQSFWVNMDEARRQAVEAVLIERGLLSKLDQGHHVLHLRDLTLQPDRAGVFPNRLPLHAFCGTAIKVHDGLLGRLYLIKKQRPRSEFTELDVQMIGTLAVHAGLATHMSFLVNKVMTARSQHIALLESTGEGIYGVDLEGRCTFINKAGASLLGYHAEDLLGQSMHRLIHHTRRDGSPYPMEACSIYRAYRTGQVCRADDEVLWRRDGSSFPAEFSSSPLYEGGILTGAVITFRDITERKRADEMRAHLVDRLISAQEEERQRIARELHDETEQALASVLVGLRAMEEVETVKAMRQSASKLRQVTAYALDELQRLVQGLRPTLLDEMGLAAALQRLCTDFAQAHGIRVELHVGNLGELSLPFPIEITLYRIVQEALTNIAKHAEATTVSILIPPIASSVRLVVEDNGVGFKPEAIYQTAAAQGRLGLYGMQERAKIAGGVFTVESAQGRGTTIYAEIPLVPGTLP